MRPAAIHRATPCISSASSPYSFWTRLFQMRRAGKRHAKRRQLPASSDCMQRLSVRWGRLIRTGVAQDPKAPLLVGHVDITAGIDEQVFSLGNEVSGQRPCALAWRRRNEPPAFEGQQWIVDVINP